MSQGDSTDGHDALRESLEGERANARHWRELAERERTELDAIRRRTSVRIALALDRRLTPISVRARRVWLRVRQALSKSALRVSSLRRRAERGARRAELAEVANDPFATVPLPMRVEVFVHGPADQHFDLLVPEDVKVIRVGASGGADTARELQSLIFESSADAVCIIASTTQPLRPGWLERLAAQSSAADTVAVTAKLVHPDRPASDATPHDLRIRSVGFDLDMGDGSPTMVARHAGQRLDQASGVHTVSAASSACVLIRREALVGAGGLEPLDDVEVSVIAACGRMASGGRAVRALADEPLLDHRPVASRTELVRPIDVSTKAWADAIESSGPALVRASGDPDAPPSITITVSATSAKVAPRWGDWHLAQALARSLDRLGCPTRVQTIDRSADLAGRASDVHLAIRGMAPVRATSGQHHVLWIISHPERVEDHELHAADLILVASSRFAQSLRARTDTPVEVYLQATDPHRFRPMPVDATRAHDVVFVAATRNVSRPIVNDAIAVGIRPAIFGPGWDEFVDPALVVADYVANDELPVIYASAGVVLNDHWDTMKAWGFVSNRIFDALACGAVVISDHVPEIAELLGDAVPMYRTRAELHAQISECLTDPDMARRRAAAGRRAVLEAHTFDHRADQLVDLLPERLGCFRRERST